jgi:hypothetical protein
VYCRISPAVTSASRTNPFRVAIQEGGEGCVTEKGASGVWSFRGIGFSDADAVEIIRGGGSE